MSEDFGGHEPIRHSRGVCDHNPYCMFCDGGLFGCAVCGCLEGSTPDECPGELMTHAQTEAIHQGRLNYREGEWREECCAIMRPVHDTDNYMREQGYIKGEDGRWWSPEEIYGS